LAWVLAYERDRGRRRGVVVDDEFCGGDITAVSHDGEARAVGSASLARGAGFAEELPLASWSGAFGVSFRAGVAGSSPSSSSLSVEYVLCFGTSGCVVGSWVPKWVEASRTSSLVGPRAAVVIAGCVESAARLMFSGASGSFVVQSG